jgi:hypothetical protein
MFFFVVDFDGVPTRLKSHDQNFSNRFSLYIGFFPPVGSIFLFYHLRLAEVANTLVPTLLSYSLLSSAVGSNLVSVGSTVA